MTAIVGGGTLVLYESGFDIQTTIVIIIAAVNKVATFNTMLLMEPIIANTIDKYNCYIWRQNKIMDDGEGGGVKRDNRSDTFDEEAWKKDVVREPAGI